MGENLTIIKKLNNDSLGKYAKKLLKRDGEVITEDELYLVQIARQITENFIVYDYIRKNLMLNTYDNLLTDLYALFDADPEEQMRILLNDEGNGCCEDLMKCTELYEMALVMMQTLIDKREVVERKPYINM